MKIHNISIPLFLILLVLSACGGGGGGGGNEGSSPQSNSSSGGSSSTTSYTLSGMIYGSNATNYEDLIAYVDSNFSGNLDNGELSAPVDSYGNFSLSTTNSSLYNCLKNMPIAAESREYNWGQTDYFFTHNPDGLTSGIILNPFTTIFSDFLQPTMFWDDPANDGQNCSTLMNLRLSMLHEASEKVMARMQTFDGLTYNDLLIDPSNPVAGNPIDLQRTEELQTVQRALKDLENNLSSGLQETISSLGIPVTYSSRFEIDTSNFRIFLNNTSYPNDNIGNDSYQGSETDYRNVSYEGGIEIHGRQENASGNWSNSVKIQTHDFHFAALDSNFSDNLVADVQECWQFNSGNIANCKNWSTGSLLGNVLTYGTPTLSESYEKSTSRGVELLRRTADKYPESYIGQGSSSCSLFDSVGINTTTSNSKISKYFSTYYTGTFSYSDLGCSIGLYEESSSIRMHEHNTSKESMTVGIWRISGYGSSNDSVDILRNSGFGYETVNDHYGESSSPPSEIPSIFVQEFNKLTFNWDQMVASFSDNTGDYQLWMVYQDKDGQLAILDYRPSNGWMQCASDGITSNSSTIIWGNEMHYISTDEWDTAETVKQTCLALMSWGNDLPDLSSDSALKNKSPYTGDVNSWGN